MIQGEEKLLIHVIVRAMCDSVGLIYPSTDISEWKIIKEASEWLESEYYKIYCYYLGLSPGYMKKLHEKIKNKEKHLTERVYSALYFRIRRLRVNNDHFYS
jgi:hypothetical protein